MTRIFQYQNYTELIGMSLEKWKLEILSLLIQARRIWLDRLLSNMDGERIRNSQRGSTRRATVVGESHRNGGTMRLQCWYCHKAVSSELPKDARFRAIAVCPECIEKSPEAESHPLKQEWHKISLTQEKET